MLGDERLPLTLIPATTGGQQAMNTGSQSVVPRQEMVSALNLPLGRTNRRQVLAGPEVKLLD